MTNDGVFQCPDNALIMDADTNSSAIIGLTYTEKQLFPVSINAISNCLLNNGNIIGCKNSGLDLGTGTGNSVLILNNFAYIGFGGNQFFKVCSLDNTGAIDSSNCSKISLSNGMGYYNYPIFFNNYIYLTAWAGDVLRCTQNLFNGNLNCNFPNDISFNSLDMTFLTLKNWKSLAYIPSFGNSEIHVFEVNANTGEIDKSELQIYKDKVNLSPYNSNIVNYNGYLYLNNAFIPKNSIKLSYCKIDDVSGNVVTCSMLNSITISGKSYQITAVNFY